MPETKQFEIQHKSVEGIDCLYLSGYLDAHTAPHLENSLAGLISKGQKKIIVNFRDLDYISSAGLGVFMAFIEDIRETGGDIKLANMRPKVFSVFELLGFPILFDIVSEEKHAIENFGKPFIQKNV
jgi:anti-sigma B factor antagonist